MGVMSEVDRVDSEPQCGWSRKPRAEDLPPRVYLRGDGGWDWIDKDGNEVAGPHIDPAGGIIVSVLVDG